MPNKYDADMLRVRQVRITPACAGGQRRACAVRRARCSVTAARRAASACVPDQEIRFDVTPRNIESRTLNGNDHAPGSTSSSGTSSTRHPRGEQGIALIVALLSIMLMTALGMALMLTSQTETLISANYRDSMEGDDTSPTPASSVSWTTC